VQIGVGHWNLLHLKADSSRPYSPSAGLNARLKIIIGAGGRRVIVHRYTIAARRLVAATTGRADSVCSMMFEAPWLTALKVEQCRGSAMLSVLRP
jgi:hypothetical protein